MDPTPDLARPVETTTMKLILGTTIAATALLGLSWTAQAGTIRAELTALPTQSVEFTLGGDGRETTAGRFDFERLGGTHPVTPKPNVGSMFWAFCIELEEFISVGNRVTYDVQPLDVGGPGAGMGLARADQVAELLGAVYPDFSVPLASSDEYAALQIAIWEIIYETDAVLAVGNGFAQFFNAPVAILDLADDYLALVDGIGDRALGLAALVNDNPDPERRGRQDMLVQFPVPEPGTLGLALLGLGAAFGLRRKAVKSA
jgi:hypothetical protein